MQFLKKKRYYNGKSLNYELNRYINPYPTTQFDRLNKLFKNNSILWSEGTRRNILNEHTPRWIELIKIMKIDVLQYDKGDKLIGSKVEYLDMDSGNISKGQVIGSYVTGAKNKKYTYDIEYKNTNKKQLKVNINNSQYRIYRQEPIKVLDFASELFTMIYTNKKYYNNDEMIKRGNLVNKV